MKFINWLIYSSADPEKVAMTIKGALTALIPFILITLRVFGVEVLPDNINEFVIQLTSLVTVLLTAFGIIRKIYLTFFP